MKEFVITIFVTLLRRLVTGSMTLRAKWKRPTISPSANTEQPITPEVVENVPSTDDSLPTTNSEQSTPKGKYCWVLVAGHGKETPGKRSPILGNGKQFFEYEFNQFIVNGIANELRAAGINHHILKDPQTNDFLHDNNWALRVGLVNSYPSKLKKVALYVHSNAGPGLWTTARGIETWHQFGVESCKRIAHVFQMRLVSWTGWTNRSVKSQYVNQFYVLRNTTCRCILTENGFFNNKEEVEKLLDPYWRQQIIIGHVEAIKYIESIPSIH